MLLFLSKPKRNPFLLGPCDLSLVTFLKYNFEEIPSNTNVFLGKKSNPIRLRYFGFV